MDSGVLTLDRPSGATLAFRKEDAAGSGISLPTVVFLGGFRSDMEGTKAQYLAARCKERGQAYIRFDYSGHGRSGGKFEDCTISTWLADTLFILDHLCKGPAILGGSSLGGWLALLAARAHSQKVAGVLGIAAAPDFTREVVDEVKKVGRLEELHRSGFVALENEYSPTPHIFTQALIDDGEQHCILDAPLSVSCPVCLVQGMKDNDVPWQKAFRIRNVLDKAGNRDVEVCLVEHGDHRLSTPENLAFLDKKLVELNRKIKS